MLNWYLLLKKANNNNLVEITESEKKLFSLIKSGRDTYAPGIKLRIAGGWIRDRLLGKVSDDIDIAVSGGNGNRVAEAIRRFDLGLTGGKQTGNPYSVSLEKTLPGEKERSAGLRVGALDILGTKIEFVPMRTESYDQNSRVPKIEATDDPREDAKRRDLTINAIYYNIDTESIEDYSGGVYDLRRGILRTPVDPVVTLKEDPLRALRVMRFLSKMSGFKISEDLREALSRPEIHEAYRAKVAPERARAEIEKMVIGDRPGDAIRMLFESGLYLSVFGSDRLNSFKPITMDQNNKHHRLNLMNHTIAVVENLNKELKREGASDRERMIAILAAIFHDFGKMDQSIETQSDSNPGTSAYHGHEDVSAELAEEILKRLGFGDDRDLVKAIVEQHMVPHSGMSTPKAIGKFLRKFESIPVPDDMKSKLWRLTYLHSIADTMSKGKVGEEEELDVNEKRQMIQKIDNFISEREKIGSKPLIDGKEIMRMFPNKNPKTGFIIEMQKSLLEAQDSGIIKDKTDAEKYLKERFL